MSKSYGSELHIAKLYTKIKEFLFSTFLVFFSIFWYLWVSSSNSSKKKLYIQLAWYVFNQIEKGNFWIFSGHFEVGLCHFGFIGPFLFQVYNSTLDFKSDPTIMQYPNFHKN